MSHGICWKRQKIWTVCSVNHWHRLHFVHSTTITRRYCTITSQWTTSCDNIHEVYNVKELTKKRNKIEETKTVVIAMHSKAMANRKKICELLILLSDQSCDFLISLAFIYRLLSEL